MMAPRQLPRRVLMSADTVGGVWTFAMELVEALGAFGVEVVLATLGRLPDGGQRRQALTLANLTVVESDFRLEWMEDPWVDVERSGDWLLDLESWSRPDVVHLNGYAHGALPWRRPVVMTGHSCVLSWWQAVHGCDAPGEWARYRQAVLEGLHGADFVAAPSAAMLAELHRYYGPLGRTRAIPNGRRIRQPGAGPKQEMILSAGRFWDPAKNVGALAAVASGLPWPVYVAGEFPPGVEATENFHRLGRLSAWELKSWLSRASIYALPARYEPFGLSVLEGALHGCALVLGDIPSLRENWEGAALFVEPGDLAALSEAIHRLAGDERLRSKLGCEARARAERFSPEAMAREYLSVYREVLKPAEGVPRELERAGA